MSKEITANQNIDNCSVKTVRNYSHILIREIQLITKMKYIHSFLVFLNLWNVQTYQFLLN